MADPINDNSNEQQSPSLVVVQIINYVLDKGSVDFLRKNHLDESYFPGYEAEVKFIYNHYDKYGVVPDISTFLAKFPDFELFEVDESEQAMLEAIKEEKAYSLVMPSLNKVSEVAREDSIEAVRLMKQKAEEILKEVSIIRFKPGYDIFKRAEERAQEYLKRVELKGVLGCVTGIEKLDIVTHGWLENDYIALTGRIQEGKSWILEYFLISAWLAQKKKVLLFSLENNKSVVGYRADTILEHFSNDGLMAGKEVLLWKDGRAEKTKEDYLKYIEDAKNFDVPFIVMDNMDNNDKPYTMPMIEELIEFYDPDIIGIDQLSLLAPSKRVDSLREAYVDITRYARQMVNRINKPVIMACQSGREAAKMFAKNAEATPELFQIAESDSVGQDATRVVSIRLLDGMLKWSLKKNTFGRSNVDGLLKWDIDHGYLSELSLEESDPHPESNF